MYVRLAVAWTDPGGTVHGAGDVVDVDAVTLAELEEQGVVEDIDGPAPEDGAERVDPGAGTPKPLIGPGPGSIDGEAAEKIGPGPGSPKPTDGEDGTE